MSNASLSDGTGPGSSISLAPETVRIRNALIEKFSGAPLEEMSNFMTTALSKETDEFRRLGILAARIYILRNKVANLKQFNRDPALSSVPALDTTKLSLNLPSAEQSIIDDDMRSEESESWSRIQMTEPGEVNGVRFLTGTIIDTKDADADKLIQSGKAVRLDEDDKVINLQDDDSANTDASEEIDADNNMSSDEDNGSSESASLDDETVIAEAQEVIESPAPSVPDADEKLETTPHDKQS